jgi:hypothetical protein
LKQSFRYGTVEDRVKAEKLSGNTVDFVYNQDTDKAKKALPYANIMTKQSPPITREQANTEAARFGLTIPDEQFVSRVLKRGRPSAKVIVTPMERTFIEHTNELDVDTPIKTNRTNDDDDDAVEVEEFEHNGKNYYRGSDQTIYCPDSQTAIGRWDTTLSQIVPL